VKGYVMVARIQTNAGSLYYRRSLVAPMFMMDAVLVVNGGGNLQMEGLRPASAMKGPHAHPFHQSHR
jgi:hypothetical protein